MITLILIIITKYWSSFMFVKNLHCAVASCIVWSWKAAAVGGKMPIWILSRHKLSTFLFLPSELWNHCSWGIPRNTGDSGTKFGLFPISKTLKLESRQFFRDFYINRMGWDGGRYFVVVMWKEFIDIWPATKNILNIQRNCTQIYTCVKFLWTLKIFLWLY